MTTIIHDIECVRSLRKDNRELKVPLNILNSIEHIHNCIKGGTDLSGWKKVEWRNGAKPGYQRGNDNKGGKNRFFVDKNTNYDNRRYENKHNNYQQSSQSPQSFNDRSKQFKDNTKQDYPIQEKHQVSTEHVKYVPTKYVSKFKKTSENVDDTILNTILLGKLNKFSELNYDEIKEFITHIIDSGQNVMIKCFMKLVFEKAASEEIFCPLYAKLLSELSNKYPVLLTEMANLYTVYISIFDEISETDTETYNEMCKRNIEKKYRRGYSQFLAELLKYNVIDGDVFMKTVNKIIDTINSNATNKECVKLNEEYTDCLLKIMKAIKCDNSYETERETTYDSNVVAIKKSLKVYVIEKIKPLSVRNTVNIGLSNKARFTLLDIYEGMVGF